MEAFVAAIILIGIGIMLRIIKLQAGLFLIAVVIVALAFMSYAGKFARYVPTWLFVAIAVVLGINLLRSVLDDLFGKSVGDGATSGLIGGALETTFRGVGLALRSIFRIKP
jgi:uncharacterized membrane protein AbrB (regulator of aidB expression)